MVELFAVVTALAHIVVWIIVGLLLLMVTLAILVPIALIVGYWVMLVRDWWDLNVTDDGYEVE